jgi:hypothetical protein
MRATHADRTSRSVGYVSCRDAGSSKENRETGNQTDFGCPLHFDGWWLMALKWKKRQEEKREESFDREQCRG